ncbi:MAG: hypothetical protein OXB88_07510 [Bacteriovoracales bacterium]|nr:hypothetical protein [Bacteriovoracales bacterium]
MKFFSLFFTLILLLGCSSKPLERNLASNRGLHCHLKKHPSKDYYQVYYKDRLLFDHWYDEAYAMKLMMRSAKMGKCD